jgi:UDP-2,3-diacylglucosamine hydrolase
LNVERIPTQSGWNRHGGEGLLVVSDAHLGGLPDGRGGNELEKLVESELVDMLEQAVESGFEPVLAGDMFDYWMEYGSTVPELGARFRTVLTRLVRECGTVDMVTGNHDNWTGRHFPDRGVRIHGETVTRESDAGRILILHGDGLRDPAYGLPRPIKHRFLRNRLFVALYRSLLPPRMGWGLMRWFSARSRRGQVDDPSRLDMAARDWVASGLAVVVVAGHDHRARLLSWENGIYVNCGFFGRDRTACLIREDVVRVVRWDGRTSAFITLDEARLPLGKRTVEQG